MSDAMSSLLKFNPFTPGVIVSPEMFCGRIDEVLALERILFQTKNGNPNHFLLQGERGIGKSSLLFYTQCVATGIVPGVNGDKYNFVKVNIILTPSNSHVDIIKKISTELDRELKSFSKVKELAGVAWGFLSKFEVGGVKYNDPQKSIDPEELLDDLTHAISKTLEVMGDEIDGIVILIDEADKPPTEARLGELLKILTERLLKKQARRVCFGLSGLSDTVKKLKSSHESSPRIFETFTLQRLLQKEREEVVRRGVSRANLKNKVETKITPDAEKWIGWWSEGYPHFIQQFAHSAFDYDVDNEIDENDVTKSAFRENGAFQQLGVKYFEEMYFDQIGSDEYREVLKAMSQVEFDGDDPWVKKQDIVGKLKENEVKMKSATLDNAIRTLKQKRIIVAKPGARGIYRFPTASFGVWVRGFSQTRIKASTLPDLF